MVIGGCRPASNNPITPTSTPQEVAPVIVSTPEMEKTYEQAVSAVLAPFWDQQKIEGVGAQLLNIKAPGKYLTLHLELVLAFDMLDRGRTQQDQALIEQGMAKVRTLRESFTWL